MAYELSKYSNDVFSYSRARQLIRNILPLKPIQKIISTMKALEQHLNEETIGFYEYLQNQIDAYFLQSKNKRYARQVTENLRTRLYYSLLRKFRV